MMNLKNSQYKNINEVEYLLNNGFNMTEEKIIAMKDNRKEIDRKLKMTKKYQEVLDIYG